MFPSAALYPFRRHILTTFWYKIAGNFRNSGISGNFRKFPKVKKNSGNFYRENFSDIFPGFPAPLAGGGGPSPRADKLQGMSVRGGGPALPASGVEIPKMARDIFPRNFSEEFSGGFLRGQYSNWCGSKFPRRLSQKIRKIIFQLVAPRTRAERAHLRPQTNYKGCLWAGALIRGPCKRPLFRTRPAAPPHARPPLPYLSHPLISFF